MKSFKNWADYRELLLDSQDNAPFDLAQDMLFSLHSQSYGDKKAEAGLPAGRYLAINELFVVILFNS